MMATRTAMTMMSAVLLMVLSCVTLTVGQAFNAVPFTLPSPPNLIGPLEQNDALYHAERMHPNRVMGPSSFAFLNGNVYTITTDGKVVNIATCVPQTIATLSPPGCQGPAQCGLLTTIRVDNGGKLLVVDAYRGVFRVDPATGAVAQLYSSTTPVLGRPPKFLNGLVQLPDGTILVSDSSDKFDAVNDIYIIMEGRASGRILALNPTTMQMAVVLGNVFAYPNGMELTADGKYLLVAESGRARIQRVSLDPATFLQVSTFADNLPGVPTHIRRSSRNTYWVGLALVRHSGILNSMDLYSNNPAARTRTVYQVDKNTIQSYYPKYGMIVEVDANGRFLGSLHDPSGQAYSAVSEVAETGGLLYVGGTGNAFAGRVVLPQGDGRVVTVDSVIQVLRSRCQIREDQLAQAKSVLQEYIKRQTGGSTGSQTTPAPPAQQGTTTSAFSFLGK